MLRIYYGRVSELDLTGTYSLSEYRRERVDSKLRDDDKRESIGAELLLNYALKKYRPDFCLPVRIVCSEWGKPMLQTGELQFSLSHSGGYAACAVSDHPVGLDIQLQEKCREKLLKRYFSEDEQEYVNNQEDRDGAFIKIWCMKESYVKANGVGLHYGLERFSVLDLREIWYTLCRDIHIAVCVPGQNAPIPELIEEINITDSTK